MATVRDIVMDWLADDRREDPEALIRKLEEASLPQRERWRPVFAEGPISTEARPSQSHEAFTPYRR